MKLKTKKEFQTIRIKKGLSITQLATLMQVKPSVVSRMEKGQAVRPATAHKACAALNETFETLFGIDLSNSFEFDLPYNYSFEIFGETHAFEISDPIDNFQFNEIFSDAFKPTSKMSLAA